MRRYRSGNTSLVALGVVRLIIRSAHMMIHQYYMRYCLLFTLRLWKSYLRRSSYPSEYVSPDGCHHGSSQSTLLTVA